VGGAYGVVKSSGNRAIFTAIRRASRVFRFSLEQTDAAERDQHK
jgi:hypothetical protein